MKNIFYHLLTVLLLLPVAALFSEGESILPNIFGFCYCLLLYALSYTKIGKHIIKQIIKANEDLCE